MAETWAISLRSRIYIECVHALEENNKFCDVLLRMEKQAVCPGTITKAVIQKKEIT